MVSGRLSSQAPLVSNCRRRNLASKPELRGTAGQRCTHTPRQSGDGSRSCNRRQLYRCKKIPGWSAELGGEQMEAIKEHEGKVFPLNRSNVDTDQIIPKQFLKRVERTGFGQFVFHNWRFDDDGNRMHSRTASSSSRRMKASYIQINHSRSVTTWGFPNWWISP